MNREDDSFDGFELALSAALRRAHPPQGFVESVMRRTEPRPSRTATILAFPARQAWIRSVAASLLIAGTLVFGGIQHRRTQERAKADRDFTRSLEITDRAMALTREKLQKAGVVVD